MNLCSLDFESSHLDKSSWHCWPHLRGLRHIGAHRAAHGREDAFQLVHRQRDGVTDLPAILQGHRWGMGHVRSAGACSKSIIATKMPREPQWNTLRR